jgi:putative tryptophan/tyrosine transport system substrate-binding protein
MERVGESMARPASTRVGAISQRRREFLGTAVRVASAATLGLLAGCGTPLGLTRQFTRPIRVGLLSVDSQPFQDGLLQGLRAHGYVEDQQLAIERRSADSQPNRLPQLAAELVDLKVDVIVAAGTAAVQAARDATRSIPIVLVSSGDPVKGGIVSSLARPGGNLTGTSSLIPELAGKRLELLQQVVPDTARVVVLVETSDPSIAASQWDELQAAADATGARLEPVEVRATQDVERALTSVQNSAADSLISLLDPLAGGSVIPLVQVTATRKLPAIYPAREFVDAGGLMAYGPSLREQFTRAAVYVDRILRGGQPAQLSVERPGRFELVINRGAAEALGISMTESALLQVDEVI